MSSAGRRDLSIRADACGRTWEHCGGMTESSAAVPGGATVCPACHAAAPDGDAGRCPGCGLDLASPPAMELRQINAELSQLASRQAWLMSRRNQVLSWLSGQRAPVAAPGPALAGGRAGRGAAALLLAAGGILLGLAAIAFAVANWSSLGPGGRAAIMLAASLLALAAPVPLARRRLTATAEAVAAVGLVLTVADAYLVYRLAGPVPGGGRGYAAMASAGLALAWAAYGRITRLSGPVVGAIVAGQFPLVLAALAASPRPEPAALALLATSAGDSALVLAPASRAAGWRTPGVVVLALTWTAGTLAGLVVWLGSATWPQASVWVASVLGAAAAAAALATRAIWDRWLPAGLSVAGGLASVALGIGVAAALPRPWSAAAFGGAAAVLIAAVAIAARPARGALVPVAFGAAVVLALSGPAEPVFIASRHPGAAPWLPLTLALLTTFAAAAAVAVIVWRGRLAPAGALLAVVPLALAAAIGNHAATAGTLSILAAVSIALTAAVAASRTPTLAAAALGSWSVTIAVALGRWPDMLAVLGLAVAAGAGCAVLARDRWVRAAGALGAVAGLGGLTQAGSEAAGLRSWLAILAVLAVAAAAQAAAWRIAKARFPESIGAEAGGWLLTAAAVLSAASIGLTARAAALMLVASALCLVTATRPGRRVVMLPGLLLAFAALLTWLASPARPAPEPWTLPAAALILCAGWLTSRRNLRSWQAFGPGLAIALVPSLSAAWLGHGALRPLLLGLAAMAIAIGGARARLQALLVLGALTAILDGGRELAPVAARMLGALPNWVPVAAIGAVLIWAGATYEARLRDLRRIGHTVGGMH